MSNEEHMQISKDIAKMLFEKYGEACEEGDLKSFDKSISVRKGLEGTIFLG